MSNLITCLGAIFLGVELRYFTRQSRRIWDAVSGHAQSSLEWAVACVVNLEQFFVDPFIGLDRQIVLVCCGGSSGRGPFLSCQSGGFRRLLFLLSSSASAFLSAELDQAGVFLFLDVEACLSVLLLDVRL